jgi:hypothetical protein
MIDVEILKKAIEEQRKDAKDFANYANSLGSLCANAWKDSNDAYNNYGKTFQIMKNRGETFHDFSLYIGKEYMNNAVNVYLREAWLKADMADLSKVIAGLNQFHNQFHITPTPQSFDKFTVQASQSHGMSNYLPDRLYPCKCELDSFDIFHDNFTGPLESPLMVRLKLINVDVEHYEVMKRNGFFYITGDMEMEDEHITDFRVEHFCYLDKNNTLNQGQILL